MAQKQTTKQLLKKIAERYEELHFEYCALQAVIIARNDLSLVTSYTNALNDEVAREIVRKKFAPLHERIASLADETDLDELLSRIPPTPTVNYYVFLVYPFLSFPTPEGVIYFSRPFSPI